MSCLCPLYQLYNFLALSWYDFNTDINKKFNPAEFESTQLPRTEVDLPPGTLSVPLMRHQVISYALLLPFIGFLKLVCILNIISF